MKKKPKLITPTEVIHLPCGATININPLYSMAMVKITTPTPSMHIVPNWSGEGITLSASLIGRSIPVMIKTLQRLQYTLKKKRSGK